MTASTRLYAIAVAAALCGLAAYTLLSQAAQIFA
jgi:hypothetical protein